MRVRVLGPVGVEDAALGSRLGGAKERTALAVLAVNVGRPVGEPALIDALWGDEPPRTATKTVQTYIARLRRVLGESLSSGPGGYLLTGPVDLAEVEELAARARGAPPAEAARLLGDALDLWRGPALAELSPTPWVVAEASRLEELRLSLAEQRSEARLSAGDHVEAVPALEALVHEAPLRERRWAHLMTALYRSGRQADALRAYQRLRDTLAEELGIEPSTALRDLEARVLAQDPSLLLDAPTAPLGSAAMPTGVVTFLLTDIEGSTALWEADPSAMAEALGRHDAIIDTAVTAHDGRLLKTKGEGDSTFSAFARATDAVEAAAAAQAALAVEPWPGGVDLRVRMAIVTGEAHERAGDYFGLTVNRGARLRSLAQGGEVLIGQTTAALLADQPMEHVLDEVGVHRLKDLSRPEQVWRLSNGAGAHRPTSASLLERAPMPGPLTRGRGGFVGRAGELAEIAAALDRVASGGRELVLLAGEPGIGKTRLAAEAARLAFDHGAAVLFGRCEDSSPVPYRPFVDALQHRIDSGGASALARAVGTDGAQLHRLVPAPELGTPSAVEPTMVPALLARAVDSWLAAESRSAPLVLVLDDLHWADTATLWLLRELVTSDRPARVLLLGTYRDTELDRTHPLAAALADLRRDRLMRRIDVGGLGIDDIAAMISDRSGDTPSAELVAEIAAETEGNAFFVEEVVAHRAEGGDGAVPEGVREVVGHRLSRLGVAADHLAVAAVVGAEAEVEVVADVLGADVATVLTSFEAAAAAGLNVEVGPGRFAFSHALVRQTLLAELSLTRQVQLHWSVGQALASRPGVRAGEVATHLADGALAGDAVEAARWCLAACDDANVSGALMGIGEWAQRAVDLLEPTSERHLLCRALMALTWAAMYIDGPNAADPVGTRCIDTARSTGDAELLAQAVLACGAWRSWVDPDPELLARFDEAIAAVGPDSLYGVRLRAEAAWQYQTWLRVPEVEQMVEEAVEAALTSGDTVALMLAQSARMVSLLADGDASTLLSESRRNERLAETLEPMWRPHFRRAIAVRNQAFCHIALGDRAAFTATVERMRELTDPADNLFASHQRYWTALVALIEGRPADAKAAAARTEDFQPEDRGARSVELLRQGLILWARSHEGRDEEIIPNLEALVYEIAPTLLSWRAILGTMYARSGRLDDALQICHPYLEEPRLLHRLHAVQIAYGALAEVVARTEAKEHAETVLEALAGHRGKFLSDTGWSNIFAAADRGAGQLLTVLGRYDEADDAYRSALALDEGFGAIALAAETRRWWAHLLLTRDGPGDREHAVELLHESLATAERIGMQRVVREAGSLLETVVGR